VRVLVTGDRKWHDEHIVHATLSGFATISEDAYDEVFVVIQGGATGADEFARKWGANKADVEHITVEADWERYGLAAGPIRNRKMIDEHEPEIVLAFHNDLALSKGTRDCVKYAREKGIRVYTISVS
jgi:hypothetical protein